MVTRTFFDANDNVVRIEQANDLPSLVGRIPGYDGGFASGHISFEPFLVTEFQHDGLNNVTQVTQSGGPQPLVTQFHYDRNENRTLVRTPRGTFINTDYNRLDLPKAVRRPGMLFEFKYDANRNRAESFDGNRARTVFGYDGFDRNVTVEDPEGTIAELRYDAHGNVRRTTVRGKDGHGGFKVLRDVVLFYDNLDRLYGTAQALLDTNSIGGGTAGLGGGPDDFPAELSGPYSGAARTLDAMGRAVALRNARDKTLLQDFDNGGRLVRAVDPAENENVFVPDANGNVVTIRQTEQDPSLLGGRRTFVTRQVFDALNRLVKTIDPGQHERLFDYDSRDNMVSSVDGRGNRTNYYFDFAGRPVRQQILTNPHVDEGVGTTFLPSGPGINTFSEWDENSNLVAQRDALEVETRHVYDLADRRERTIYADRTEEVYSDFDGNGNPGTFTDRRGVVFTLRYDALGRMTSISGSRPADSGIEGTTSRTMRWDGLGRLAFAEDSNGGFPQSAELFYNGLSQIVEDVQRHTLPSFQTTEKRIRTVYNAAGEKRETAYPSGMLVHRFYQADGQLSGISVSNSAVPEVVDYTYAGPGRVAMRTFGNKVIEERRYDLDKQLEFTRFSREGKEFLTVSTGHRDGEHNILTQVVRNHLAKDEPPHCGSYDETLVYDAAGRLKTSTRAPKRATGQICFGGLPTGSSNLYDAAGNSREARSFSRHLVGEKLVQVESLQKREVNALHQYTEVSLFRFERESEHQAGTPVQPEEKASFSYDGAGNLTGTSDLEVRYDVFGRPVKAIARRKVGQIDRTKFDVVDLKDGDRLKVFDFRSDMDPGLFGGGTIQFSALDLRSGILLTFSYGVVGNTTGSITFSTTRSDGTKLPRPFLDDPGFRWSPFYVLYPAPTLGALEVGRYYYDGLGRRTLKIVDRRGQANGEHEYWYEGMQVIEDEIRGRQCNVQNQVIPEKGLNRYVWGRDLDELVRIDAWREQFGGSISYVFSGPAGQVFQAGDQDPAGYAEESADVSPGGVVTVRNGKTGLPAGVDAFRSPFLWHGHALDEETGFMWARARYFSPQLGRFIQTDPLGAFANQGGNPYTFAGNNAVSGRDASGMADLVSTLETIGRIGGIAAFVGGVILTGGGLLVAGFAASVSAGLAFALQATAAFAFTYTGATSFADRLSAGDSVGSAAAGAALDATGINGAYGAFTSNDLVTGRAMEMSAVERILAVGSVVAAAAAVGGARASSARAKGQRVGGTARRGDGPLPLAQSMDDAARQAILRDAGALVESKGLKVSKVLRTKNAAEAIENGLITIVDDSMIKVSTGTQGWAGYTLAWEREFAVGVIPRIMIAKDTFRYGVRGVASALAHEVGEMAAMGARIRVSSGGIFVQRMRIWTREIVDEFGRITPHGVGVRIQQRLFPSALPE